MKVTLTDFTREWQVITRAARAALDRVGGSGLLILGSEVKSLEECLGRLWGLSHAVGVACGLDAIEIGLRCLGLRPGGRVLTTPLSAFATTLAIVRCGGVPEFVDVDSNGLIDLDQCRRQFEDSPITRFFVPVHLYGHCLNMEELQKLREDFDLRIVEDCAQSIGARWGSTGTGTVGQVAATSFYPTKNLGALGDGGALLTGSEPVAEQARALRDYGQSSKYVHDVVGYNSRLDELHAAILHDAMLPWLAAWTAARRATATRYSDGIQHPAIVIPQAPRQSESVHHLFPVLVPPTLRDAFIKHMGMCSVATGVHYPRLIPEQKALANIPFEVIGSLSEARRFASSEVSLPIHPFLTSEEVTHVIDSCNAWKP